MINGNVTCRSYGTKAAFGHLVFLNQGFVSLQGPRPHSDMINRGSGCICQRAKQL